MTMVLICYFLLSVGIFLQQSLIPDLLDLIKTIKSFNVIFTHFETVSYFSQQLTFHANCLLWTPLETICIECQRLLSGKNKKNIINLPSAEFAQRVNGRRQFAWNGIIYFLNKSSAKRGIIRPCQVIRCSTLTGSCIIQCSGYKL